MKTSDFFYQDKKFNKYSKSIINKRIIKKNRIEEEKYQNYFLDLTSKLYLGKRQNNQMIKGYIDAINYYQSIGKTTDEILSLLDTNRLGDVYTKDQVRHFTLDNSAIVYPLAMGHGSMGMFRVSYYLKTDVKKEILQIALNNIIKRFPTFQTSLRRGFFWHYLDSSRNYYKVRLDNAVPCTVINLSSDKSQAFKVYYYQNRISVDFFHVLTDGSGGLVFLNTLVSEYLSLLGIQVKYQENVLNPQQEFDYRETKDMFYEIPNVKGSSSFSDKMPHQLGGFLSKTRKRVIHFTFDTNTLIDLSHKHHTTITILFLSYMFLASKMSTKYKSGNFYIQLPVNMRKFYPSNTLRNFSLYAIIKLNIDKINNIDDMIEEITKQVKEKTTKEKMDEMSTMTKKLVNSLNYVPLLIKYLVMKIIYPFLSERVITTTLSNLGVVSLPNEMLNEIDKADFVLGVQKINRATCSLITINNKTVFTISKVTNDSKFEDCLNQIFKSEELSSSVTGGENFGL